MTSLSKKRARSDELEGMDAGPATLEKQDVPLFMSPGQTRDGDADQPRDTLRTDSLASTSKTRPSSATETSVGMTARTTDGRTLWFRRRQKIARVHRDLREEAVDTIRVLEKPVHAMKVLLEEEREKALLTAKAVTRETSTGKHHSLWTDKYRPCKYQDLLGNEKVNRELMAWLKAWDHCVFGRKAGMKAKVPEANKENQNNDPLQRPQSRILLLAGPAGLGKTTLAHVLARQAGYDVMEINASDDRTGGVVKTRIAEAMSTRRMWSSKPVCVVIDEIDGVSGQGDAAFIQNLIKLIEGRLVGQRKDSRRTGQASGSIRPIICVCNDLSASVLRPLRPHAQVVRFHKPPTPSMIARLHKICKQEGLSAESKHLGMLCEITNGDIRSCLNTLQFIQQRSDQLSESLILSTAVGAKDSDQNLQNVWNSIFMLRSSRQKKRKVDLVNEQIATADKCDRWLNNLANDIDGCSDISRLAQGCFEHYPLGRKSGSSAGLLAATEWLSFFDRLEKDLYANQEFSLGPYRAFGLAAFHHHFADSSGPAVAYPRADYEAHLAMTANLEIAAALRKVLSVAIHKHVCRTEVASLFIPLVSKILSPELNPINSQLIKRSEKEMLKRLIEVSADLGLRYNHLRNELGQMVYVLEPPLEQLITFSNAKGSLSMCNRYATRAIIARELESFAIRRSVSFDENPQVSQSGQINAPCQKTSEKADEKPASDFFGRKRPAVPTAVDKEAAFTVLYVFHDGSSAAVRTRINMSAIL